MSPHHPSTQHHHAHFTETHELPSPQEYPPYDSTSGALIPQVQNTPHDPYHQPSQQLQVQPYAQQPQYYEQAPYERRPSHHSHHLPRSKHSRRDVERRPTIGGTLMLIIDSIVGAVTGKRR
ncbi:hypothetical protein K491DRAFT_722992 [Lophiostoma macrostomum CBS 122681]|uniref:Uncharacterized protein n=1 Tax=Lophiostoma macrostomum CBS 122681 TaxID=1314788 RepID=A0A6A6SKL4_9PLEO|nr:hypothetical protein K491DRAFT_722992 [Lophiostoma macrostomum CBS 122681]